MKQYDEGGRRRNTNRKSLDTTRYGISGEEEEERISEDVRKRIRRKAMADHRLRNYLFERTKTSKDSRKCGMFERILQIEDWAKKN